MRTGKRKMSSSRKKCTHTRADPHISNPTPNPPGPPQPNPNSHPPSNTTPSKTRCFTTVVMRTPKKEGNGERDLDLAYDLLAFNAHGVRRWSHETTFLWLHLFTYRVHTQNTKKQVRSKNAVFLEHAHTHATANAHLQPTPHA